MLLAQRSTSAAGRIHGATASSTTLMPCRSFFTLLFLFLLDLVLQLDDILVLHTVEMNLDCFTLLPHARLTQSICHV